MIRAALALLGMSSLVAACIPPPRCGSAANIEMWRTEDRPPPPADNELSWQKRGCGPHDKRVPTMIHMAKPLPGVSAKGADVFFMPATSYAVWLMTHATANAVKGLPIAVDPLVLQSYSKQATVDADGNADLGQNFPGIYVAFTVYDVIGGDPPRRDVFVYERVFEITSGAASFIELTSTQHLLNPPSTPAPPSYRGQLVDIRRVHDDR